MSPAARPTSSKTRPLWSQSDAHGTHWIVRDPALEMPLAGQQVALAILICTTLMWPFGMGLFLLAGLWFWSWYWTPRVAGWSVSASPSGIMVRKVYFRKGDVDSGLPGEDRTVGPWLFGLGRSPRARHFAWDEISEIRGQGNALFLMLDDDTVHCIGSKKSTDLDGAAEAEMLQHALVGYQQGYQRSRQEDAEQRSAVQRLAASDSAEPH